MKPAEELFLSNLRLHDPTAETLRCPICDRGYGSVPFTDGHVYPKLCRSGDGGIVPECKGCNDVLGHLADSDLVEFARMVNFGTNRLSADEFRRLRLGKFQLDGSPAYTVKPRSPGPAFAVGIRGPYQPPVQLPDGRVQFKFRTSGPMHASLLAGGIVHSGFLKLFRMFGFEYTLDPAAGAVQGVLAACTASRDEATVTKLLSDFFRVVRFVVKPPGDANQPYIFKGVDGTAGIMCFVPLAGNLGCSVLMPGFGDSNAESYRGMMKRGFDARGVLIPTNGHVDREIRLRSRLDSNFGRRLWEDAHSPERIGIPIDFGIVREQTTITITNPGIKF